MNGLVINQREASASKTLYTGIANLNIVAINPPSEEVLHKLSPNNRYKEISADTDQDGNKRVRIDFYYEVKNIDKNGNDHNGVFSIFMVNASAISSKNNTQYINSKGQSVWVREGETPEEAVGRVNRKKKWFSETGLRTALQGEAQLYEILTDLFNFDAGNPTSKLDISDRYSSWFEGNFQNEAGFMDIVTHPDKISVRRLLGVKNGQYQDVWLKGRLRQNQTPNAVNKNDPFIKELIGEYGPSNFDYQGSLALKVYEPNMDLSASGIIPDSAVTESTSTPFD